MLYLRCQPELCVHTHFSPRRRNLFVAELVPVWAAVWRALPQRWTSSHASAVVTLLNTLGGESYRLGHICVHTIFVVFLMMSFFKNPQIVVALSLSHAGAKAACCVVQWMGGVQRSRRRNQQRLECPQMSQWSSHRRAATFMNHRTSLISPPHILLSLSGQSRVLQPLIRFVWRCRRPTGPRRYTPLACIHPVGTPHLFLSSVPAVGGVGHIVGTRRHWKSIERGHILVQARPVYR